MSQQDTTEVPFLNVLTIKKKNFAAARPKIGQHENQKKSKNKISQTLELFQNKKTGFNDVAVLEKKEEKENHSKRQREQQ